MRVKIFFCYAHEDEQLLNKLKNHLFPLKRTGLIEIWHDRDISAGTDWEQQIKSHLNQAQIILLLISPDFMVSDYCYGSEMKRALERHDLGEARVIPIILRHIYWQGVLGKLQALPTDARPVKSWPDLDELLYNVTEGILKVIEEITPESPPPLPLQSTLPVSQTPLPTNLPGTSQKTKEQWLVEGNTHRNLNQFSEVLAALRLDPNYALVYSYKGYILNILKRYQETLAACEQAIRLDPNDAPAYNNKGVALFELKRYQEALEAYDQAIHLDPNYAMTYNNKSEALDGLNKITEAQQAYEKARQLAYNP